MALGLRVDPGLLRALKRLAQLLTERAHGAEVSPTTAARAALELGARTMLDDLGEKARPWNQVTPEDCVDVAVSSAKRRRIQASQA